MDIHYRYNIGDKSKESQSFNILNFDNIVYLNCCYNKLNNLPILPINLQILYCSRNYLSYLHILPNYLKILRCNNNILINLPILPNNLLELLCYFNKLNYIPKINKYIFIIYDKDIIKFINIFNKEYNLCMIQIKIYYYIKF